MFTKKTRLISLLVTISMLISMVAYFTINVAANTGATPINSAAALQAIADDLDGDYILTGNIDLNGVNFKPIGTVDAPFTGTFDGDGYTISNLTLDSDDNFQGLFGVNNGTIRNVKMDSTCSIGGNAYVGAIAGKNASTGIIENCISEATVSYKKSSTVGGTYTVMTQNLCQWGDSDFALSSAYENASTKITRRPGMLTRIKTADPDLIAFQENSFTPLTKYQNDADWWESLFGQNISTVEPWNTYLQANLTGYTFFGSQGSLTATPNEGATVAYKTDRFNQLAAGTFWHSTNPDAPIEQQDANWDVEQANGELWGLGAGNKRVVNWVALEDKTTHQQIVLYSLHPQHDSESVRQKEIPVLIAKMDALRETYPDAIFIAAGDYNANKGAGSYNMVENYLNGEMDNVRDIAEETLNGSEEKGTCGGGIFDNAMSGTIDHIFVDGSAATVKTYEILDGVYNSAGVAAEWDENVVDANGCTTATALRPSDHNGVVATFEVKTNEAIGGVVGENAGSLRRIVAAGTADATAIGLNNGTALAVFGTGTKVGEGSTKGIGELTEEPSLEIVWKLNHAAEEDVFALVDGDYRILREGDTYETPVRVRVNGIDYYTLPNSGSFNLDELGIKAPMMIQDGKLIDDPVITVGTEDINVSVADSIMNVTEKGTTGVNDFVIKNQDELEYADSKLSYINKENVTLYLGADIDLTESSFNGFDGKILFSLDGLGHTIKNWNTTAKGFFVGDTGTVNGYQGAYIKNITFDNVHTKGTYGRAVVVANAAGNNDFLMENVHVKNSSTTITNAQNSAAILYTHSNNPFDKKVTIRNCSIVDSQIKKADGITGRTNSGAISGRIGNGITYVVSDIYVKGFDNLVNDEGATGTKGNGILFGTKEDGVTLTLNNAAIFDSSAIGFGYDLVGWQYSGNVKISNVISAGNATNGLLSKSGGTVSFTNVYTDQENKVTLTDAKANNGVPTEEQTAADGATDITLAQVKDGSIAYTLNNLLSKPSFYWEVDEDSATGALKPATAAEQTRKVTLKVGNDESVSYVDGGETLTLSENAGDYFYVVEGNGTVTDGVLTVSTDKDTVVRKIAADDPACDIIKEIEFFNNKNLAYYKDGEAIAAAIETLENGLKNGAYISQSAVDTALPLLTGYKVDGAYPYATPDGADKKLPSVQEIANYTDAPGYMINNVDDLLYVKSIETLFTVDHTLYLGADLDLSGVSFTGFVDLKASFDGLDHKIMNWGTQSAPISTRGFFQNTYGGTTYIKSIKNLILENCHTTSGSTCSAMLYGVGHNNGGVPEGSTTNVTLENIHFVDCSMKATAAEGFAFLLARYSVVNSDVTINVANCSVTGSTFDGSTSTGGHYGLLIGKPRSNNNGNTTVYNLTDCYLADNTMKTNRTDAAYQGLVIGTAENAGGTGGLTKIVAKNLVVVNNTYDVNAATQVNLFGDVQNSSDAILNGVIYQGNTVTGTNNPSVVLFNNGAKANLTNVYCDNNLTKVTGSGSAALTGRGDVIESGKAAADINATLTDPAFYWTINEEGKVVPSDLANSTHKADLMANGKVVKSVYANGGESVTLSIAEDPAATFTKQSGSGTLSGKTLTMPQDGSVTKITVNTSTNAFDHLSYPAVSTVTAALAAGGNYTIYNEADWDHLETYVDYFNNADVVIHLAADIDLSKISFICFDDPYFSFDGHGHTVSNWGTEANPARSNGMFRYNANEGRMKYIKNLNIENCHTKYNDGASGCTALLFTNECGDGGYSNAATDFTIDNIHIKDCSVIGIGNRNAVILSAYANSANAYTVTIKNCSIVDTDFTPGVHNTPNSAGHAGMLMGKVNNNTSKVASYNFSNIYLSGNTMNAGRNNYDSFMLGNIEGTYSGGPVYNVTINMNNIVATDNVVNSLEANIGLVGNNDRGIVNVDGMILLNNDYKSSVAITSTSLFASNIASESKLTVEDVYTDEAVTANMQGASGCTVDTSPNAITSGEAAYGANAAATADSIYYWRTEEGKVVLSDLANSTHKAELVLANGTVLKNYYANGGEKVTLEVEEDLKATFALAAGSSGSVSGRTLTMPTDGTVARVVVTPSDANIFAAYGYTSVSAVDTSAARTETNFTVANATEWMKVASNLSYFNSADVTIHLIGDINLGESVASGFAGFSAAVFNFDGHNHTVSNFTKKSCIGIFPSYQGASIKNVTFDNIHTGGAYGRSIVVAMGTGTTNFVMDNVHVRNSSTTVGNTQNLAGVLYSHVNETKTKTVTIQNCSVINTDILNDTATYGNRTNSAIVGGRASNGCTYIVRNLYVEDFQNNASASANHDSGSGIIFGTIEGGLTSATVENVVITNSGGTSKVSDLVGRQLNNKTVSYKNILSVNNDTAGLLSSDVAITGTKFSNVITDHDDVVITLSSGVYQSSSSPAGISEQKLEEVDMLTFAGTMNDTLTAANGYKSWTVNEDNLAVYATEANATRRVSYQVGGREIGKTYANGGSQITLGLAADPKATFALGENDAGTLDGNKLTLPTVGYMVVPIAVSTSDAALATVYGYPAVTTVTEDAHRTGLNYTIANADEWMHFFGQYNHFQSTDVTIHIIGEVDLAGKTAEEFYTASESALGSGIRYSSFMNSAFSLDGHGNTIKNWGTKDVPMATMGLYRYNGSAASLNFIKNLVIDNWHTTGSGGSDTTFLVTLNGSDNTGRNNLSDNLVIENVHIKDSSLTCEGPRSGFFIANYVKADGDYSVTLKNCSLTNSTMNGTTNGHQGLLIGKASSFNGKKATYNLSNIYVAGNTMNAKRDAYVGLGIGNIEINGNAVAQMKVNMSNVVFEDNTLNSISATPALFGQFVGTEVNAEGVVFADNTVTSTVEMTGRTIFTAGATTQNVAGLYHDDANVTKAFGNSNNAGVKYGEEYMTSGEAAAAANVAGEESVFFYTTTEDGVELGTEANATRRVVYAVDNREVEFIGYANGGEEIEIGDYAYDPASTMKFEGAEVDNPFTVPTAGYMMVPIDVETTGNSTLTTVYGYPAVTTVEAAVTSGDYTVANAEEWMYVANHTSYFSNLEVTIHLIGTIDFSEDVAKNFTGFQNVKFSLNGHDHTLKDWKPTSNASGLFNTNGDAGMKFIKNFTIDNADVKLNTWAALVFGSTSNAANNAGYYANFELSGIHVKNTTVRATGNGATALFGQYRRNANVATTVTVRDCSFENVEVIGTGTSANHGMIFGRLDKGSTFNIYDIYINNCKVTNVSNSGIVGSGLEAGTLNAQNIGVFNSTHTPIAGQDAHLFCVQTGGTMYFRYNIFAGNTLNPGEGCGKYVIGGANGANPYVNGSYNDTNQCDDSELSGEHFSGTLAGAVKGQEGKHLKKGLTEADFTDGKVAYTNNGYSADLLANRSLFWTIDADGNIIPADGNQTRKVTFTVVDDEGNPSASQVYTYYTDYTKKLIPEFDSYLYKNYEWTNSASEKYTLDTTFTADAAYTAVGVVLDELEDALAYFSKKNLGEGTYFKDAAGIQALLDEIETRIAENEYQVSENAVPGLGFASLDKDIKLVKERYATYQDPNGEFTNVPKVSEIGIYADAFHYTIWNETDLLTAKTNEAKYPQDSTLNLMADLDLTDVTFAGFSSPKFNFDGHEHTIANWTHDGDSTDGIAFISRGTGHSIKNLTFDAATVTGGRHSGIVYGSHNSDTGMTGTLTIDNVHVKNSVLNVDDEQAAIFLPNTQSGRAGYVINNCSIIETTLNAPSGKGNLSGFVARLVGGSDVTITNCYIEGFDIPAGGGNVSLFCGKTESSGSDVRIHNAGAYDCNLNATAEIYLCSARTTYTQAHNLQNIMLYKINAQSTAGRDKVFITYGNLDNIGFNTANNDDATPVNIFMDQETRDCLHTTYPAYHKHDSETPDKNIKNPTILEDDAFTNGKAAWQANQVLIDAENDTRWKVGDHGDYPVIDSLAASDWKVPYQVILKENRTKEGESYDFYTNKSGALNATAQERMGTYEWTDANEGSYTATSTFNADNTITLESIVIIDVTWGEMEFVYNFGEWDEDNCVWVGNGWELAEGTDNGITFANNGTVYREVALTYEKGGDSYGLAGQITKVDDLTGDLSAIPVDADGAIHSYEFMLNDLPAETWDDNPHTVGNLTISIV